MAWDAIPEKRGYAGDKPVDIFDAALREVAEAYINRFGRPPMIHELLYSFEIVLRSRSEDYIYNFEAVDGLKDVWKNVTPAYVPILPDDFQASWCEKPEPDGSYLIEQISTQKDVLACSLIVNDDTLEVRYKVLEDPLTEYDTHILVASTILQDLTDDFYADKVDKLLFLDALHGRSDFLTNYPKPSLLS